MRARRLGVAAAGACALALLPGAARVGAQAELPSGAIVVRDPVDTAAGLDLTRVQLGRAADGRLRAALTLAAAWRMQDLPADDGPPGSLCLRMWTETEGQAASPDRLLCVTADKGGRHLRGSIMAERGGALERVAEATPGPLERPDRHRALLAVGDRPAGERALRRRGDDAGLRAHDLHRHGAERAGGRDADTARELIGTRTAAADGETRPIRKVFAPPT